MQLDRVVGLPGADKFEAARGVHAASRFNTKIEWRARLIQAYCTTHVEAPRRRDACPTCKRQPIAKVGQCVRRQIKLAHCFNQKVAEYRERRAERE